MDSSTELQQTQKPTVFEFLVKHSDGEISIEQIASINLLYAVKALERYIQDWVLWETLGTLKNN